MGKATLSRLSLSAALLAMAAAAPACALGDSGQAQTTQDVARKQAPREKFMYIVAINRGGTADPDSLNLVGTDPEDRETYGKIFNRVDLPNVGDEVHHFAYSINNDRLLIPGLFSGRMHVFDLKKPRRPTLTTVGDTTTGGYIVPHSVIPMHDGTALVTMIGSATATSGPGGIIRVDDQTGNFVSYFGPGPNRNASDLGEKTMYDFDIKADINRGVSTTFGLPANVGGGISPGGLGDEVSIWDIAREKVIQTVNLGTNSGALESRFIDLPGSTYGYTNTPGTGAVWLWEDEDHDGFFAFHKVLEAAPGNGLALPIDMVLSSDYHYMYLTNWFGDNVQQYDITDRYHPVLLAQAAIPHANMIRLSVDGKRLYVTNELLSTWDDDAHFGPARNTNYGLWAFDVDTDHGGLTSFTADGSAWVKFDHVQKKTSVGPAGPHMMLFDPKASPLGEH